MKRFIRLKDNHYVNVDAISELRLKTDGSIEVRYTPVYYEVLHFDTPKKGMKEFSRILNDLEGEEQQVKDSKKDWRDMPVSKLTHWIGGGMGTRAYHCCVSHGMKTLGDFENVPSVEFLQFRNAGKTLVGKIHQFLKDKCDYEW